MRHDDTSTDLSEGPKHASDGAEHRIARLLLIASLAYAVFFFINFGIAFINREGWLVDTHAPFGGDFINLWTAARLILSGDWATIYDVAQFMQVQQDMVGAEIGVRLWAYPPHSLLMVWPFGLIGYLPSFVVWSLLGLAVLAIGARRYGLSWTQTGVLVLSPAALVCVESGQTGNFLCGLLLIALSSRTGRDPVSIVAAALMTIKPQMGCLIPVLWLVRRNWILFGATAIVTIVLALASIGAFGLGTWFDYFGLTVPALSRLEAEGSGPFMYMIASVFMSLRLLGVEGGAALLGHLIVALPLFVVLVWRLHTVKDADRQTGIMLIGTVLLAPYLHVYDLTILLAGAFIGLRGKGAETVGRYVRMLLVPGLAWLVPTLVLPLGLAGLPLSPVLVAVLFFLI